MNVGKTSPIILTKCYSQYNYDSKLTNPHYNSVNPIVMLLKDILPVGCGFVNSLC